MEAKKKYEEEILRRAQLLPEDQLAKVVSLMETLEEEEKKKQHYQTAIAELRGKYKDSLSSVDEFIKRKQEEKALDR